MDTTTTTNSFPVDSLGRRVGIVGGFSRFTDDMLSFMKNDLSLYMSVEDLKFCRNSYMSSKQNDITLSELYLLDTIIKGLNCHISQAVLSDLLTNDQNIINTYNDMMKKNEVISSDSPLMLTIENAAGISSKYMGRIGISPKPQPKLTPLKSQSGKRIFSAITDKSGNNPPLPINTAFVMVTPQDICLDNDEYISRLERLTDTPVFERAIIRADFVGRCGIAVTLAQICDGIFADLYSIPELPEKRELSHLASECHGRLILALAKDNISALTAAANELELNVAYFAKSILLDKFMLLQKNNASMLVSTKLLRDLGNLKLKGTAKIIAGPNDVSENVLSDRLYLRDIPLSYGDTLKYHGYSVSPLVRSFSENCFCNAINTVIDTILPIVVCGAARTDVSIRVDYRFPSVYSENALGICLATVLGAYRATCELCVADIPYVTYSDGDDISLTCAAYAELPSPISAFFSEDDGFVYLLSFDSIKDLPDFDSLRGMIDCYNDLTKRGVVKSARAFNGMIDDTARLMLGNSPSRLDKTISRDAIVPARGILIESSVPLEIGIPYGKLSKVTVEEDILN